MKVFLPDTLDTLWELWDRHPDARVYAGGTDLLVRLREGAIQADALFCLERIASLREILEDDDYLYIGAATPHTEVLAHPRVRDVAPVLTKVLRVLGSPLIRNMGTLGGNLGTASPAGDSLPALYVLDAEIILANAKGRRTLPVWEFITGPGQTRLNHREIITGVRIKKAPAFTISHYEKVGKRRALAIAVASLAARIRLAPDGTIEAARLAWGSVGSTIVTISALEACLVGKPLTPDVLKTCAPLIEEAVSPIDDIRASAAYRRTVAVNLFYRLSELPPLQKGRSR